MCSRCVQVVEQRSEIVGISKLCARGQRGLAKAAHIVADDAVATCEEFELAVPHTCGEPQPVNQDDGDSLARDLIVEASPIDLGSSSHTNFHSAIRRAPARVHESTT